MYKKILIINPFGIGDVLFTTPILHTLKDAWPDIKIGYLCNRRTEAILENNQNIDFIYVYERDEFEEIKKKSFFLWFKKIFALLNQIKKEKFDLAIDFSLNLQYGFFSWYSGIKKRIGYDYKKRGRFLTEKTKLRSYYQRHIVDYYNEILKKLSLEPKYVNLELYLKEDDINKAEAILRNENLLQTELLIGIIPGAGRSWGKFSSFKHWPAENFSYLADKLIENYKAKIIIMGDFSEQEIAQRVVKNMHNKATDLSGKTSLSELAGLLSKMRLLITNDGGPLHMAVALGINTVSLFGPVDETVYGPYPASSHHIVIKYDIPCRPCYQNFRMPICDLDRQCIKNISVQEVFESVQKLL